MHKIVVSLIAFAGFVACSHGSPPAPALSGDTVPAGVPSVVDKVSTLKDGANNVFTFPDGRAVVVTVQQGQQRWTVGDRLMTPKAIGPQCFMCDCGVDCAITVGSCVVTPCNH